MSSGGGHVDLTYHRKMTVSTELQTSDVIDSWCCESVKNTIDKSRHYLHLEDNRAGGIVYPKAVRDIGTIDAEKHVQTNGNFIGRLATCSPIWRRAEAPSKLLRLHINGHVGRNVCMRIWIGEHSKRRNAESDEDHKDYGNPVFFVLCERVLVHFVWMPRGPIESNRGNCCDCHAHN